MTTIEAGVLVPRRRAPLVAAALRQFAATNGGLPSWARDLLAELETEAMLSATTSGVGRTGSAVEVSMRNLTNVTHLSTKAAAQRLGITERGIRDLCERGSIDSEKVGGRWAVTPAALDEYMAARSSMSRERL